MASGNDSQSCLPPIGSAHPSLATLETPQSQSGGLLSASDVPSYTPSTVHPHEPPSGSGSLSSSQLESTSIHSQTTRNQEKQAVRDARAKQDRQRLALDQRGAILQLLLHSDQPSQPQTQPSSPPSTLSTHRQDYSQESAPSRSRTYIQQPDNVLPPGMDIREALAKCEDPALGWSNMFWVCIADPVTQHVFFACPASGQCSWDPPVGAFVVPRSPQGEWWELADASRGNRSYYYNTLLGKTQWTRPTGDAFVIPLGLIQSNALPARPNKRSATPGMSHLEPRVGSQDKDTLSIDTQPQTPRSTLPRPPPSPRYAMPSSGSGEDDGAVVFPSAVPTGSAPRTPTSKSPSGSDPDSSPVRQPRPPLSVVEETSGNESGSLASPGLSWREKRQSKMGGVYLKSPRKGKERAVPETWSEDAEQGDGTLTQDEVTSIPLNDEAEEETDRPAEPSGPIWVDSVRTKRMSTGLHPLLPTSLSGEIQSFRTDDFAAKYFATRRSGVFRSRVPLERIMEWQKQPIAQPLLVISKSLTKEAVTTFRVIQHVMGERDKPVENARPVNHSSHNPRKADLAAASAERTVILEEIRWMIQLAVGAGEMRDEVYSQLIKQLTKNPDQDSVVLGFQLFCVLTHAFAPSQNFEVFVKSFLQTNANKGKDGVAVMAKYCHGKLEALMRKGGRGRNLTLGEIEQASDAAFYPSVYGERLERIMELQAPSYPSLMVPVILPFLADGIIALGGLQAEGIFRVPGDSDSVYELKSRIDRGHYQLNGIDDPHVAASLFKLFLRDLDEPVIPTSQYNAALSSSTSPSEAISFVKTLPILYRRVLVFAITFAQLFMAPQVVKQTKMTPQNLALVLAPNILRTTSDHLVTVFTNSGYESRFVLLLLQHLVPADVDPDYVPTHGRPSPS